MSFVHLHLHSEYSLVDGIIRIEELIANCVKYQMPAVAITDQCNLFAAVKFYQEAIKFGIKPILGSEMLIENTDNPQQPYRLILLCLNGQGYKNLTCLITKAYIEGQAHGLPLIKREWLNGNSAGLLALSGGLAGDIGVGLLAENQPWLAERLQFWQTVFPNRFYIELQRIGVEQEEIYNQKAIRLALTANLPLVATNSARFLSADDYEAHEARVCIHEGYVLDDPNRPRRYQQQQYLRSPQEMQDLFADIPQALQNTVEIAKRCSLKLSLGKAFLPNFPTPNELSMEEYLCQQARQGFQIRRDTILNIDPQLEPEKLGIYNARLERELHVITSMGFAGYFLIVADFIRWAKELSELENFHVH